MPFLGELSALLAASLWAVTSMLIAKLSAKIGSVSTNILRMLVAILFFLVTIFLFKFPINLSSRQMFNLIMSAIVGLVFGDTFLFKAFQQIGARISMLIMSLAPAMAAILAYIFLGETLSSWGITGIFLTLGGISFVVFERTAPMPTQHTVTKFGLLCAFGGALGQGISVLFAKMAFDEGPIHGIVASFIRISVAVLILLPIASITGLYRNPIKLLSQNRRMLAYLLIVSFFGTYLGVTLSLVAIAYAKVGIASTLLAISPVLMLPLLRIVYKEVLSWKAMIGAFVAVGGVAILFLT